MVDKRELNQLVEGVLSGKINRRELMQRAAALWDHDSGRSRDASGS